MCVICVLFISITVYCSFDAVALQTTPKLPIFFYLQSSIVTQ